VWARGEVVDKDRRLLELKTLGADDVIDTVPVRAFTLGYLHDLVLLRDVKVVRDLNLGLGGDVTFYGVPDELHRSYGRSPVSVHAFARVRWGRPHAGGGHGMSH